LLSVAAAVVAVFRDDLVRTPELPTPFNSKDDLRDEPAAAPVDRVPYDWRHAHSLAVQEAVLRDLLAKHDPHVTICVALSIERDDPRTPGPMNDAPTPGWRTTVDAPVELRRRLASLAYVILPNTRCHVNHQDLLVDPDDRPAAEVGVGPISWVSKTFVKTDAYVLRGGFWGASFSYTLSLRHGRWQADRVVLTGIS
jgi:hypothetical protein